MKVAIFPRSPWWRANPYLDLLENGLKQQGVEIVDDTYDELGWRWILDNKGKVQILHLHWLQYHYDRETFIASCWALIRYGFKLCLAKLLGYRLIWTVHNLEPHEQHYPLLDKFCGVITAGLSHCIIVHSEEAKQKLAIKFTRHREIYFIPHPNYIGVYPGSIEKGEAKRRIGFTESNLVFLCFGAVRPYKGFQDAVITFKHFPGDNYRLVVAGLPIDEKIKQEISWLASVDSRIKTILRFIPDNDLPTYFSAADVVLLPFRKVTTSGSAILAMSFGCPIIAPALGSLSELVSKDVGVLYDPSDTDGLIKAMRSSLTLDLLSMGQCAYKLVEPFSAREIGARHLKAYSL